MAKFPPVDKHAWDGVPRLCYLLPNIGWWYDNGHTCASRETRLDAAERYVRKAIAIAFVAKAPAEIKPPARPTPIITRRLAEAVRSAHIDFAINGRL
jgi:hypothetical protein